MKRGEFLKTMGIIGVASVVVPKTLLPAQESEEKGEIYQSDSTIGESFDDLDEVLSEMGRVFPKPKK